jgi:hypothetical protein
LPEPADSSIHSLLRTVSIIITIATTMLFHTLLAALTLVTAASASLPMPRELADSVRENALDKRVTCEIPGIGPLLCIEHCQHDHDTAGKSCTGVCVS